MKVLVTDPIAEAGLDRLREAGHDVVTAHAVEGDALLDAVADAHALIVGADTPVTESVFAAAPELRIVALTGVAVDNVDVEAATDHGVVVANGPEGAVRAAAEHAIAMTFATARSIPQTHGRLRRGEWAKSDYLGSELDGKTAAIVGLGRIGQQVATRLGALGMEVVATDPAADEARADRIGATLLGLEAALERADFLVVTVPLTDETAGLIGEAELATMADGYVVTTSRGGVVDEAALAEAVEDDVLRGAAVDLYDGGTEADDPLLAVDDVVVAPHSDPTADTGMETVATATAEQVLAALRDDPVANALNAPSGDQSTLPRIRPYADLAETAGVVAAALFDGRVTGIEVGYGGDIATEDVELVTLAAQQGVFASLGWEANAVDAPRVAAEHDVAVTETTSRETTDFTSQVTVTVRGDDAELAVSGTLFAGEEPRLVSIDGYRVDAVPHGHVLVAYNRDEPGVIGTIGTVLGDHDVNIAGMFNGREAVGGEALTVYTLDDPVTEAVLETLRGDDRITDVKSVALNDDA
ncbi:MAG: phosphoglycerate dehydrogenase [Halanaeroarchaeum sp.]